MATEAEALEAGTETDIDAELTGRPVAAFLPRLGVWAVVLAIIATDPDPAIQLLLIALAGIITIITDSRFRWERWLEEKGIPSREAWVPLAMLALMMQRDLADGDNVHDAVVDKGPVILFILAFALVAEGLRRSGFIHFLAYRLTERGGANTTRLTLYLFLLSSLLTYFTSNDIVVLTMTPIVVSVVYQARIRNAKLLLLSQFVAANTVSMGILIGSPSNLILGRAMNIRFFEYFFLMLAPSMMALMTTFVFVTWINWFIQRRGAKAGGSRSRVMNWLVGTWTFSNTYTTPRFSQYRSMTNEMRRWVTVFGMSTVMLMIGTATDRGLIVAATLIGIIGVVSLRNSAKVREEPTDSRFYGRMFRVLPIGIVFFGLTYFVIADAIGDTRFVREDVDEYVTEHASNHTPLPSWGSMLVSGGLVNTMNDLPASALAGTVLERAEFKTPFDRSLVVQGSLTGLNIATYVTPVGALAGIIWFDILRKERQRRRLESLATVGQTPFDVIIPRRRDLVAYGSTMFLAATAVLGATNFGFVSIADALLGPPSGGTEFGSASTHILWSLGCIAAIVAVVVAFRVVLRSAGVALAHLGDVLVVLTRVRLWASRHRMLAAIWIAGLMFLLSGALLYWSESFYAREFNEKPLFETPGEFITWLTLFVSSGFENRKFPRSTLGHVLSGLLALGSIAVLVVLVRLSTGSTDLTLRRKLGRGEIPSDRLVVVNCSVENLGLVRTLIDASHRFVTIATRDPQLESRFGLRKNDRVDVVTFTGPTADLVEQLRLDEARELVVLSRSVADDFKNLALLGALDGIDGDPPAIILQVHEREVPGLIPTRLSQRLQDAIAQPPFDRVVRAFLVADAAGRGDDLRALYSSPLMGRDTVPDVDPHIDLRGVGFSWDDDDIVETPRRLVRVVGAGCFAQACALELAAGGVASVQLIVTADEALLPGVAGHSRLTVKRCSSEREVAEELAAGDDPEGEAILVLDGAGEEGFDCERMLERLSLSRLHALDAGRPVPYLLVGCRGAEAARRIANFVVDKVIDTTWVEASYFTAFSRVYFDVVLDDEELANWSSLRQLAVANRSASQLCHLDVGTRGTLRSTPLGTLRFEVEHVAARPVVAVDAKIPSVDEHLTSDHLVLGAFYT